MICLTIFTLVNDFVVFSKIRSIFLYEETNLLLSNDVNERKLMETSFWSDKKVKKIANNFFSNCSLEILNLHRKSSDQQKKSIAPSVTDLAIALCSSFVHNFIFYANLKFPMGHGILTKQVFIAFHLIFQQ